MVFLSAIHDFLEINKVIKFEIQDKLNKIKNKAVLIFLMLHDYVSL